MAGLTVNEGLAYLSNLIYKADTRYDLTIGLFTNAAGTLDATSTWASITQPSGTGYSETALTNANFVVDAQGDVTYNTQLQWTAGDNWTGGDVTGYYIRNQNASPVLVHIEYRDAGAFAMTTGRLYTVDITVDTS